MPGPVKDWSDFEYFVRDYIPRQTIPILKRFSEILESYTGSDLGIRSTDKKAQIVTKVEYGFRDLKGSNRFDTYRNVRANCESIGLPARVSFTPSSVPTFGGVPQPTLSSSSSFTGHSAAGLPSAPPFRPAGTYAPPPGPRPANGSGWAPASSVTNAYQQHGTGPQHALMDWKKNPMWKPVKAVSGMELLPDIDANQKNHFRKDRRVALHLPPDVVDKLKSSKDSKSPPHYSLRLFCTSSDHYRPPSAPYSASTAHIRNVSIPIEYPSNPDISVDYQNLPFKQRGLRGKPGSAPPFDLGSAPSGLSLNSNRMTTIVFGHTGPTSKKSDWKRFWFQIVLAEVHTKDELLSQLVSLNPTSAEASIAEAKKRLEDDEIELGVSKMTLKDPLSYMRITRPIRSSKCSHIQCFDATWWIESNFTHPMWQCPLCNKELQFEDLIVDGYFFNILNSVPESVEDVVVEPNFEWHTEDNKFGSINWLTTKAAVNDVAATTQADVQADTRMSEDTKPNLPSPEKSPEPDRKGKRKAIEILSSDDDEDDVPLRRTTFANGNSLYSTSISPPLSPLYDVSRQSSTLAVPPYPIPPPAAAQRPIIPSRPLAPSRTPSAAARADKSVIDLTADSSDEEGDPSPPFLAAPPMQKNTTASSSSSSTHTISHFHLPGAGITHHAASASNRLSPLLSTHPSTHLTTTRPISPAFTDAPSLVHRPSFAGSENSRGGDGTGVRQIQNETGIGSRAVVRGHSASHTSAAGLERRGRFDTPPLGSGSGSSNGFGNYTGHASFPTRQPLANPPYSTPHTTSALPNVSRPLSVQPIASPLSRSASVALPVRAEDPRRRPAATLSPNISSASVAAGPTFERRASETADRDIRSSSIVTSGPSAPAPAPAPAPISAPAPIPASAPSTSPISRTLSVQPRESRHLADYQMGGNPWGTALTGGGHWSPGQSPSEALETPPTWANATRQDSYRPSSAPRPPSSSSSADIGRYEEHVHEAPRSRYDSVDAYTMFKKRPSASDWMEDEYYR
ncbi:hypothetical protein BD324DRAFT_450942 [Kockovaella imperatae]|uniref:SP-RING-type domain-containing protein n=1 Tax=Kockovaella imperatae TaxID=4999 RepID=A0A1Y1UHB9_9TREE|nr:hypothetical protein BD324DRAFT_450942 [Kockovaella imperatae]ORX37448.1 hypothetical protein BD324DRAFT_450942 [Kockovaella imperatae]